jgi:hypothetical protein
MKSKATQKMEIGKKLSLISKDKLDDVADLIDFILSKSQIQGRKPLMLRGIWKDKGFEKIKDIESALKEVRTSLTNSILD